jgi:hypothetical protein
VLRLDLIAAAQDSSGVGPPFSVAPVIEGSTLTLRSRPLREEDTHAAVDTALAAITAGMIEHFEWDHRAIAMCVPYPLLRKTRLSIRIGDLGVYTFTSLQEVAKQDRHTAAELIRYVLTGQYGARDEHRYDVVAPADAPARRSNPASEQHAARDHTRQSEV